MERTEEMFVRQFTAYLNQEDRDSLSEMKLLRKNTAVIYCKSWEDCNRIVNRYRDTKFENEKVYFLIFSSEKPK